jgi:hypothetical protein
MTADALLLYAASLLVAAAAVWRLVFRPLGRFAGVVRDVVEQWRQTQESVRELAQVVARYVVESDRRLTRLEALWDLQTVVRGHQDDETASLLGKQLSTALQHPLRRGTDHPEER